LTAEHDTLLGLSLDVLRQAAPDEKTRAAEKALRALEGGAPLGDLDVSPPDRPARPGRPALAPPAKVPRRRLGSPKGRAALLHAIAHIEFNAIDLGFDMAVRFARSARDLGLKAEDFVADWIRVGADEARHFNLIEDRLSDLGFAYGDFLAHDGLWEAAARTADSMLARLAVAPLILEARGLDVTPGMISRLSEAGDQKSADALKIIYTDEIGHVACGERWFSAACRAMGRDSTETFRSLRSGYFSGELKPPFNHEARAKAGLPRSFYDPI